MKTIYFRVKGRVQGVFFRASCKSTAEKLGIAGWVKNTPDGDVEGVASGPNKSLIEFTEWLHQGPRLSKVTSLEVLTIEDEAHSTFEIR